MTFTNVRSATHYFSSPYKQVTSPAAIRAASSAAAWKAWENDMAEKVKKNTHLQSATSNSDISMHFAHLHTTPKQAS